MKKVIVGLTIAMLAIGAAGCSKDKKSNTPSGAPDVASESLKSVEVKYQRDDPSASDPSTALTCKYMYVSGSSIKKAELKTSGRCDFEALKANATDAGSLSSDTAAQIIAIATSENAPGSAREKRGCTAINVKTSLPRSVGVQDCVDNSGNNDSMAKELARVLGY